MALCLPKEARKKLLTALKSGDVSIEKLYKMTSEERRVIFKRFVDEDFATFVNGKFEQAMVSNQRKALKGWIEATTQFKDPVRRDMLKKVERIKKVLTADEEKGFLKDLAELKLGIGVTEEEASIILSLKKTIDDTKAKWDPKIAEAQKKTNGKISKTDGWENEIDRYNYGYSLDAFKEFVGGLKLKAEAITIKERFKPTNIGRNIVDLGGVTKSMVATLDNSFIGRQGWKTLLAGQYKVWWDTVISSFKNFGKELMQTSPDLFKARSDAVMSAIRADIFSRPNAMNGKYNAAKNGYGLKVLAEEVFPTSLPERIPFIGRVFKASETAFAGSAMRMRADLADAIIAQVEKNGLDMLDEKNATAMGSMITAMTGRGELGKGEVFARETNAIFFSIKFLKSNFDTLTAHQFDKVATPESRSIARKNIMKIAASVVTMLGISDTMDPGSVEWDPRSTKFAKICPTGGNSCFDITGGMSGLVVLGSRLVPTKHQGEWGLWTKSKTGKFNNTVSAEFGQQTALDTFENFFEGKLSPIAGALRDFWRGQNFQGEKPTFVNTSIGLVTPISAEMAIDELQKGNDDLLVVMFAELVGISPTESGFGGFGKRWDTLKEEKGIIEFNKALKVANKDFNKKATKEKAKSGWKKLTTDEQNAKLDRFKKEANNKALSKHGL